MPRSQWAVQYCPDAARMNVGSDAQKAHLLFAPCDRVKSRSKNGVSTGAGFTPGDVGSRVDVVLGTPDTYAADATRWPEHRVFQVG